MYKPGNADISRYLFRSVDDPVNGIIKGLKYSEGPRLTGLHSQQLELFICGCFNKWFERRVYIECAICFSSMTQ